MFLQIGMGALRLGFLAVFLSDALASGFTTGAAFHVFTSQLPQVFGVKIRRHSGTWKLIKVRLLQIGKFRVCLISCSGENYFNEQSTFANRPSVLCTRFIVILFSKLESLHKRCGDRSVILNRESTSSNFNEQM